MQGGLSRTSRQATHIYIMSSHASSIKRSRPSKFTHGVPGGVRPCIKCWQMLCTLCFSVETDSSVGVCGCTISGLAPFFPRDYKTEWNRCNVLPKCCRFLRISIISVPATHFATCAGPGCVKRNCFSAKGGRRFCGRIKAVPKPTPAKNFGLT